MGKFVHRGFMHPGGVSPMKQEDMFYIDGDGTIMLQDPGQPDVPDTKSQVEKKTKEIKEEESMTLAEKEQRRRKQYSPTYNASAGLIAKGIGTIASFFTPYGDVAVAGTEIAEGEYAQAAGTLALGILPGSSKFWKGLFKGGKKAKNLNKSNKNLIKKNNPKTDVDKPKFETDNTWEPTEYNMPPTIGAAEDITAISNARGTGLDEWLIKNGDGIGSIDYTKSVTKLPSKSGRDFVKVDLPNGESQIFYKSTGKGGKAGSSGEWIPFEGLGKGGWFAKTGSRGTFNGEPIQTIVVYKKNGKVVAKGTKGAKRETVGVYQQMQDLGLNPWEEIEKGNLKLDHYGQGFKYGGKEYVNISKQLKNMDFSETKQILDFGQGSAPAFLQGL
tara:strand:- start:1993 stop:3150 length:1158 start_codon:yes stop_codon:yes gene_type:complete